MTNTVKKIRNIKFDRKLKVINHKLPGRKHVKYIITLKMFSHKITQIYEEGEALKIAIHLSTTPPFIL